MFFASSPDQLMGNWYTNICVKGVSQEKIARSLEGLRRRAFVTPALSDWVFVYDEQCEEFDLGVLESLALTLSAQLECTAVASFNADDDVLWLGVYEQGALSTRYASSVNLFEDGAEFPPAKETAEVLARIFNKPQDAARLRRILRRGHGALGLLRLVGIHFQYLFEVLRHQELAALLGVPADAAVLGYKYMRRGERPSGIEEGALLRVNGG
jgi:hypothetical protein